MLLNVWGRSKWQKSQKGFLVYQARVGRLTGRPLVTLKNKQNQPTLTRPKEGEK